MNELSKYLKENNIKKSEFAKRIGVHFSYITHLSKGRRTPSLSTAIKIQEESRGAVPVSAWVV